MCVFGNTVASWIYLQPPLDAVEFAGVRVYDSLSLLRVILKQVSKLVIFWHQFVYGIEGILFLFEICFSVAQIFDIADEFLAFSNQLFFCLALKLLTYVLSKVFEELNFLNVLIIFCFDPLLLFLILLIKSLDQCYEVFLDEVFLLPDLHEKLLQFLLDEIAIFPEQLYLIVEFCQLIEDAVFVFLIDF